MEILDFFKILAKKRKEDELWNDKSKDPSDKFFRPIKFYLASQTGSSFNALLAIIKLDEEDIAYFEAKYKKLLEKEKEKAIQKVIDDYSKID